MGKTFQTPTSETLETLIGKELLLFGFIYWVNRLCVKRSYMISKKD
jgi:hypothetical protein